MKKLHLLSFVLLTTSALSSFALENQLDPYETKIYYSTQSDEWGNDYINASYDFEHDISYAVADLGQPYAFNISSKNSIDAKVLANFNIISAKTGFAINDLSVGNLARLYASTEIFGSNVFPEVKETVSQGGDVWTWSTANSDGDQEYMIYQEYSESKTYSVFGIPVDVEVGVSGEAGVEGEITLSNASSIQGEIELGPKAEVGAFVSGNVKAAIAEIGVGSKLNLLEISVKPQAELIIGFYETAATLSTAIPFEYSTLDGSVYAEGKLVSGIKWCKKWGIKYPCGLAYATKSVDLFSWDGYDDSIYWHKEELEFNYLDALI